MLKIVSIILGFFLFQSVLGHTRAKTHAVHFPPQTSIEITYPNSKTVWMAPGHVIIKWNTENIMADKTIQFYLVKDNMVIQELGIFINNKFVDKIALGRGLTEASNYRVIGIELFPDDKYSIAKFTTDFFTIKKTPPEEEMLEPKADKTVVNAVPKKTLVRETFGGRKLHYTNEVRVKNNIIKINLRDHGRVDGDIVSIYLNGEAIVSKYLLTYRNKTFEVQLDPTKPNDLFLYAHNLGKVPPNTVAIEIRDGQLSKKIILNSDLKSCEAVLIKVGN